MADVNKDGLIPGQIVPFDVLMRLEKARIKGEARAKPAEAGDRVDIPEDWESLHWKRQVELANRIIGGEGPLVPSEGQTVAEKARAIIMSEVSDR
ncbi:hypothetical protein [Oricola thermophila]|uniref:Uncharacterized protein n=1 Tax=Oricola thermophila TaxID=2742145 RepID=A0A6N1VFC5_9HYPH|nr:hypothetical protein [Oricola thermophila]QKV17849.1 hypothetical protein HTY61_04935 [Oricola thermophila]